MISENFIYLAVAFNISGSLGYARSTFRGRTKPNRVSWFLWAFIPLIAFLAQIDEGVGRQSLLTAVVGVGPLLILCASFTNKGAYWRISKFDISCGTLSILAMVLWLATGNGLTAILLSIVADLIAGAPTFIKSYYFPETENSIVFRNGAIGSGITLLTIDHWTPAVYSFALYIFILCIVVYILITFKLGLKFKKQTR